MTPEEIARRHARALERARRMDRGWFENRPFAIVRVRDSLPYEAEGWDGHGHIGAPYALVFLDKEDRQLVRRYFKANRRPDQDHATCMALWLLLEEIEQARDEGRLDFPDAARLQRLNADRDGILSKHPNSVHFHLRRDELRSRYGGDGRAAAALGEAMARLAI